MPSRLASSILGGTLRSLNERLNDENRRNEMLKGVEDFAKERGYDISQQDYAIVLERIRDLVRRDD